MAQSWINITSRLQQGITLINSIPKKEFIMLLHHIAKSETKDIFSQPEITNLAQTFKMDSANVQLLVQTIAYIFNQSSKVILKPTILQEQLVENLKFDPKKAEEFIKLWTQETKKNFDVENSKNLDEISWELNLQVASNLCSNESNHCARLQMRLADVDGNNKENLILELSEEQLTHFYTTIENIQSKLDSL